MKDVDNMLFVVRDGIRVDGISNCLNIRAEREKFEVKRCNGGIVVYGYADRTAFFIARSVDYLVYVIV